MSDTNIPVFALPGNGYSSFSSFIGQSFSDRQLNYGGPLFYSGSSVYALGVVGVAPSLLVFTDLATRINNFNAKLRTLVPDNTPSAPITTTTANTPSRGITTTGSIISISGSTVTVSPIEYQNLVDVQTSNASTLTGPTNTKNLVQSKFSGCKLEIENFIESINDYVAKKLATFIGPLTGAQRERETEKALNLLSIKINTNQPTTLPLKYGKSYLISLKNIELDSPDIDIAEILTSPADKPETISPISVFKENPNTLNENTLVKKIPTFKPSIDKASQDKKIPFAILVIPCSDPQREFTKRLTTQISDDDYPKSPYIIPIDSTRVVKSDATADNPKLAAEALIRKAEEELNKSSAIYGIDVNKVTLRSAGETILSGTKKTLPHYAIDISSLRLVKMPPAASPATTAPSAPSPATTEPPLEPTTLVKGIDYLYIPGTLQSNPQIEFKKTQDGKGELVAEYRTPLIESHWGKIALTSVFPQVKDFLVDVKAKALSATLPSAPYKEGSIAQNLDNILTIILKIITIIEDFVRMLDNLLEGIQLLSEAIASLEQMNIYVLVVGIGEQSAGSTQELRDIFLQAGGIPRDENLFYAAGIGVFGILNPSTALSTLATSYGIGSTENVPDWLRNRATTLSNYSPTTSAPINSLVNGVTQIFDAFGDLFNGSN